MNLSGIKITKEKGGANRRASNRSTSGLIISTPNVPSGVNFNEVYKVSSLEQIQDLNINVDFDNSNNVNVFRHFSEFFRTAENSTKLYFMLVEASTSMGDILEDTDQKYAKKLLLEANAEIRQIAIAINSSEPITYLDGLPQELHAAIPKAQGLALWAYDNFMPCHVFLEGYSINGNLTTLLDLRNIPNLEATKVSIVIGQDYKYAQQHPTRAKFADVGHACLLFL